MRLLELHRTHWSTTIDADQGAPSRGPRRRDAPATRRSLLLAAQTLIGRNGIDGTSTRDIAGAAGVNQALVYRYFGSRDNLIAEALGGNDDNLLESVASTDLVDLPKVLLAAILKATAVDGDAGSSLSTLATSSHNDAVRPVVRAKVDALSSAIQGRLGGDNTALRAELLVALGIGVAIMREKIGTSSLVEVDPQVLEEFVDRMAAPVVSDRTPGSSNGTATV